MWWAKGLAAQVSAQVSFRVDAQKTLGDIAPNFLGLGYETSSAAIPGLLNATNRTYVQLVQNLGPEGVIRIGGNVSDYSSFSPHGKSISAPKATVLNEENLSALGSFLRMTGWKLIWGLNLGSGSEQNAVEEAQAVMASVGDKLLAFEIGNEPDLFGRGTAHRPRNYSYEDYLREFRRYKAAVRAKLPGAPFAGPDAASATNWVTQFAADEGNDLKLLTHHYYRHCAGPTSTLDKLLTPDPKLPAELKQLESAAKSSRVPYRICETNSFCGGGQPGVSDTFGSALWMLDYLFTLAWAHAAGVNIETGVNQLGFVSSYSPIAADGRGDYVAKPDYYGMLAFAQAARGQKLPMEYDAAGTNVSAYAVLEDSGNITVTVVNKDASRSVAANISLGQQVREARALRLQAPSLRSQTGTTLGGAAASKDGQWTPTRTEPLRVKGQTCNVTVPAGSAAIVRLIR
jgi:hypothetical protein